MQISQLRAYQRRVLAASESFELMLARWQLGIDSALHDHCGGHGRVVVMRGSVCEQRWSSARSLYAGEPSSEHSFAEGDVIEVGSETVHSMRALTSDTLTLHLYLQVERAMRLHDPARRQTLLMRDGSGAYWPPASSDILEAHAWPDL